ncbi:MAG: hypothetical protein HKP61_15150 [Dactylosporangium sp.]|nr:hypothetical protein [Dactylosporangium sp.]NNJ62247.1 hypothetical protein [Dactylosporangium sp.]
MACNPFDPACLADAVATQVGNTVLGQISQAITSAEEWLIATTASWWVLTPSISLYPGANHADPAAAPLDAITKIQQWILPITLAVATGGMLWQGLMMVLSRKPNPLVNVLRGLWNTALWSAVGIFGTNLLLAATDGFSRTVLLQGLGSLDGSNLGTRLSTLLVPLTAQPGGLPIALVILVAGLASIGSFIQALLMFFRDGSVLVLAALMPLAAAGSFTSATSGWLRKVLAWQLSLIFYKPMAALVYATAFALLGTNDTHDPHALFMGIAMMIISLVALPVLLKFFNWTVGSLQGGGGNLGLLASAGAAGLHAGASLRGSGAGGANEHARYLDSLLGGNRSGSPGGSTPAGGPGPGAGPGFGPGPAVPKPPVFVGQAGPGKVANITSLGGDPAASGSASTAASTATTGGTAAAASGATTGAATAAPATGPGAPVVLAIAGTASAVAGTAKAAAQTAASAAEDSTKDG